MFLPLLEERAGVRSSFSTDLAFRAALTLTLSLREREKRKPALSKPMGLDLSSDEQRFSFSLRERAQRKSSLDNPTALDLPIDGRRFPLSPR
jgi:hypothetical protein